PAIVPYRRHRKRVRKRQIPDECSVQRTERREPVGLDDEHQAVAGCRFHDRANRCDPELPALRQLVRDETVAFDWKESSGFVVRRTTGERVVEWERPRGRQREHRERRLVVGGVRLPDAPNLRSPERQIRARNGERCGESKGKCTTTYCGAWHLHPVIIAF